MVFDVRNSTNSALVSGLLGVQNASNGITQSSISIAQQTAQLRSTQDVLSDAAAQQIGLTSQLLPTGGNSITSDLVSLSVNLNNAQASSQVLDVANDTVGRLIDEIV